MLLRIDGKSLDWPTVVAVARQGLKVGITDAARRRIASARKRIEACLSTENAIYGVTTGFGKFASIRIPATQLKALQINLLRSHAAGVGPPFDIPVVRAMLLLRANALAVGVSGVRTVVVETLLELLNKDVHPVVPSIGSLGASGDLAPLAHLALPLIGEGKAEYRGRIRSGRRAMAMAGISLLQLEAKEGLALLNGTQAMTALACLLAADSAFIVRLADLVGALSVEATLSSRTPFDAAIHKLRPYPGAQASAATVSRLLEGSGIVASHAHCARVQDPYSLRCIPQVHGATRDAVRHLEELLCIECNAATDNPLVLEDGRVVSGGNFHGQPIALRLDYLALALHELGSISERRIDWIMNPNLTDLHAFLAPQEGLNSGYMIAQYTAAALVSENKTLCGPASADSIPVSGNQEDHVSMGLTAARNARRILENTKTILAIEAMCGVQAIRLRGLPAGPHLEPFIDLLNGALPPLRRDRIVANDIEKSLRCISSPVFTGQLMKL